jgi:RHH-type proline utilization regulon transcriptional repressor/proline dehydrogenase/delta 1-pyrroline-5-carboxylate dehydrogenase
VQKDVEKKMMEMLRGAAEALVVGDPRDIACDVGPVIDDEAQTTINAYCAEMEAKGKVALKLPVPLEGRFVAPHIVRVSGIGELEREIFGPVLHVATFGADEIDRVIAAVNLKGYGLTFGLHTRIEERVQRFVDGVHAGNLYVNRNQIGAVVGAQPFGGEGLSGTGPKAGGPHYLRRFRKSGADRPAPAAGEPVNATMIAEHFVDPVKHGWAGRGDRIAILRKHLRGKGAEAVAAAASLDLGPYDLPGPTGEANTLMLPPRGRVLCLGPEPDMLLAQTVQALAAGNAVVAVAPGATQALQPLLSKGLPLNALDGVVAPAVLSEIAVDLVAFAAADEALRAVRTELAQRTGPIVPVLVEVIDPAAYAHERAVCVDTTAAGGNASLLAAV